MYFPTLSTMKRYKVDDFLIKKLDIWLGTRRKAIRKFLSPLQFSIDTDIQEDVSIDLFFFSTENHVDVLKQRIVVNCPNCDRILGVYENPNDVPTHTTCIECNPEENMPIDIDEDMITIWFELTKSALPQNFEGSSSAGQGGGEGNGLGLRPKDLIKSRSPMARRYLAGLDERFRSSS